MEQIKDVFISYKEKDEGEIFAVELKKLLESRGFSVYFNPYEHRSNDFTEKLRVAIENCKDFILVVSAKCLNALMSGDKKDWVRYELLTAKENNKNIIPILINEVKMPADFELMPEELDFLPKIDNIEIQKFQHLGVSPLSKLLDSIVSKPEKDDIYRYTYNGNSEYDVEKEFKDTLKRAESGDFKAMYEIANMYYYGFTSGEGVSKRNFPEAYKWFNAVSGSENEYCALADAMIAKMFYRGVVPRERQSFRKSFEYHKKAASKSTYSKNQCAYMQAMGIGCDFDFEAAEQQYLEVVENSDNVAVSGLAGLYVKYGKFDKAAKLYEKMINTYPAAAFKLGVLYKDGVLSNPPKPDYFKAAFYFQHAISGGYNNAEVYNHLGHIYFLGACGFIQDFKIAEENFKIAAEAGHLDSQYMLGYMYEYGFVEHDIEKAIYYHKLAADGGNILSLTHLAILYQQPECVNYHQAFKYASMAADLREKEGEYVLGNLLLFGRGCCADTDKAYEMYKLAAEHGFEQALIMMEKIDNMEKNNI